MESEPTGSALPAAASAATSATSEPRIDQLVLDAGPLLAQLPLRNMSKKFYVPPMVMAELKDKKARDHLDFLKVAGMELEVREAGPEALAQVIAFAKQTGDYAVLSRPDLSVLALAYALEVERHGTWRIRSELGGQTGQQKHEAERVAKGKPESEVNGQEADPSAAPSESAATEPPAVVQTETNGFEGDLDGRGNATEQPEPTTEGADAFDDAGSAQDDDVDEAAIAAAIANMDLKARSQAHASSEHSSSAPPAEPDFDGEDGEEGWTTVASSSKRQQREDEDFGGSDGEGEWITSDTITKQKQKDLGLVTDEAMTAMRGGTDPTPGPSKSKKGKKGKKGAGRMTVATMTADYAVQNVLLQMGMALVSTEGYRIERVKSWILRCHACFKVCKDSDKKFCPSCGNPTLLRTSVTSVAPGQAKDAGASSTGGLQIHLKKNFQYRSRGTIYSLPLPKPSSSSALKDPKKHAVPILREDQAEWQRGLAKEQVRRHKEQKALDRALEKGKDTLSARYDDPDWIPGLLTGDSSKPWEGLPSIGAGRRNPNQAKHGRRRK
ncbi:unnamed protein product [Parajaminaea phylloscopi]